MDDNNDDDDNDNNDNDYNELTGGERGRVIARCLSTAIATNNIRINILRLVPGS